MKIDSSVRKMISAAYSEKKDVFMCMPLPSYEELCFDDVKTVVFLNGSFYCRDGAFADKSLQTLQNDELMLLFADIRLIGDKEFRQALMEQKFFRMIIPFAECADNSEYGYRESYGWIGEMKAETDAFIQTVALFSCKEKDYSPYMDIFGCRDCIYFEYEKKYDVCTFMTESPYENYRTILDEIEKYVYKRICVVCNSRSEGTALKHFIESRGHQCLYADGRTTAEELEKICFSFYESYVTTVVVTKSFFSAALFNKADFVIFCGIPFSEAHMNRASFLADGFLPMMVYCREDYYRNRKIIDAFSVYSGIDASRRISKLDEYCITQELF